MTALLVRVLAVPVGSVLGVGGTLLVVELLGLAPTLTVAVR